MGALTIGALIHQSRGFTPTTTRKRGPLGEFQRVDLNGDGRISPHEFFELRRVQAGRFPKPPRP